MQPKWVIPCNWGFNASGTNRVDAQIFAREVGDRAQVVLPQPASRQIKSDSRRGRLLRTKRSL